MSFDGLLETAMWVLGLLLILAGAGALAAAIFADRSRGRRRCPRCWYEIGNIPVARCPECGRRIGSVAELGRTRRRWKWAIAALGVMLAGCLVIRVPQARAHGWPHLLPLSVWGVVLRVADRPATPIAADWLDELQAVWMAPATATSWERLKCVHRSTEIIRAANAQGVGESEGAVPAVLVHKALLRLAVIRPEGSSGLPTVEALVARAVPSEMVRLGCVAPLSYASPKRAIPTLRSMAASDPSETVRATALTKMAQWSPREYGHLSVFVAALSDESPAVRIIAAQQLGWFGATARPALTAINERIALDADQAVVTALRAAAEQIQASGK